MKQVFVLKPVKRFGLIALIVIMASGCSSLSQTEQKMNESNTHTQTDPAGQTSEHFVKSESEHQGNDTRTATASESERRSLITQVPNSAQKNQAQDDTERRYLALLANEISALEAILHKAELHQNKEARVKFQYGWLRDDFTKMKSGILAHVNAPRAQPRKVEPLQGGYRQ